MKRVSKEGKSFDFEKAYQDLCKHLDEISSEEFIKELTGSGFKNPEEIFE
jgi:hypothetical protein